MIGIGSKVWMFDINRRIYRDGKGGPVYREHWVERQIVGENRRSWLIGFTGFTGPSAAAQWKAPKKGAHNKFAFSLEEVEDDCWINGNRSHIANAVNRCNDAATLRKIAELIGYKEAL